MKIVKKCQFGVEALNIPILRTGGGGLLKTGRFWGGLSIAGIWRVYAKWGVFINNSPGSELAFFEGGGWHRMKILDARSSLLEIRSRFWRPQARFGGLEGGNWAWPRPRPARINECNATRTQQTHTCTAKCHATTPNYIDKCHTATQTYIMKATRATPPRQSTASTATSRLTPQLPHKSTPSPTHHTLDAHNRDTSAIWRPSTPPTSRAVMKL